MLLVLATEAYIYVTFYKLNYSYIYLILLHLLLLLNLFTK